MSELFTVLQHLEERDDGTKILWPAADTGAAYPQLQCNPGDWVLAYIGVGDETDPTTDAATPAILRSEDLDIATGDTQIVLTFGAYYDPTLPDPPFATANGGSGTFSFTQGGVVYTCHFSGPYCAIPPDVVDLEDNGFIEAEVLGQIDYNVDPGTNRYPVKTPSSHIKVHSKHIETHAGVRRTHHPHNQGRLFYDNLKFVFAPYAGTPPWAMDWFTEDTSLPAHIRNDSGAILKTFSAGAASNVPSPPLSSLIVFNTVSASITVAAADGSNSKTLAGMGFDWVDPSVDLTTDAAIPIIVVGNVTASVDSNSGLPSMKGWHANTHLTPTDSIMDEAVTRRKIKGGTGTYPVTNAGAVLSLGATADTGIGAEGDVKLTGASGVAVTRSGNTITISGSAGVTSLGIAGSGTTWTGDVKLQAGTGIQLLNDSIDHGIEIDNVGVTSVSRPSGTAQTGAVVFQGSGGIAVGNAGSTFTIDGSGISAGITGVNINGGTNQSGPHIAFTARNGLLVDDNGSANTIAYLLPVGSSTNRILYWNDGSALWEPQPVSSLGISGGANVKSGRVHYPTSAGTGPVNVTFGTAFSSAPEVTLTVVNNGAFTDNVNFQAYDITTTGFGVYTSGTLSAAQDLSWIATDAGNP